MANTVRKDDITDRARERAAPLPAPRDFAETAQELRSALDMSRAEFSRLLLVGHDSVWAWENGKRQPNGLLFFTIECLWALCVGKHAAANLPAIRSAAEGMRKIGATAKDAALFYRTVFERVEATF